MVSFNTREKFETINAAYKALEAIQESAGMSSELGIKKLKGYKKDDMMEKAQKDAVFFEHLFDEVIGEKHNAVKPLYNKLITEAMVITGQLLQEADIAPKTISPIVDNEILSEDRMVDYYKRSFNLILESGFNKPNIKSELIYEDVSSNGNNCSTTKIIAPGVQGLMVKCAKSGILDNNDPEAVAKYLSAEQTTGNAISNILIPNRIMQQIGNVNNNLPDGYASVFGNGMGAKIAAFKQIVSKIAAIVAPFIFMNALNQANINVPFNPVQVAGIGIPDLDSDGNLGDLDSDGNI